MLKIAKFGFMIFGINTYVVYDPAAKKAAIIDPAMINEEEEAAMVSFIRRENLEVTHVINTHLHIDHAIGNKYAAETFKAPILAHRDDEFLGKRMREQAAEFNLGQKVDNVSITTYLEDGDMVKIGNGSLEVLHVPGHSPGSIALYDADDKFVIVGDALFAGSIGRTDLPGGDYEQLIKAIRNKLMTLPPDTVVYPGHGPATTIERESATNPFLR